MVNKITITKVEEVDKKFVEKMLDSEFCLSDKIWSVQNFEKIDWKKRTKILFAYDFKEFIKNIFQDCEKNLVANKIKYSTLVQIIKNRAGGSLV